MKKKLIKKIIYYILLTIAFLILPFSIRNVYLSILVRASLIDIIINILSGTFIFLYPFVLALMIRYNLKHDKWPMKFLYEEDEGDENE